MIYSILRQIHQASGLNEKKAILAQYEDNITLRCVLFYAYNPYMHYHIQQGLADVGKGVENLTNDRFFILLDSIERRDVTGHEALARINSAIELLTPEDGKVFRAIVLKDLRCGINIKTINAAMPGLIPTFDVMLAKKVDWKKVIYPCYSSPKIDGVRALYHAGKLWTRSGRPIIGCDHICEQLEASGIKWLDGELMIPELGFDRGSGAIRSKNDCPTAVIYAFDIPYSEASFNRRLGTIDTLADRCKNVIPLAHYLIMDREAAEAEYEAARANGQEGSILKPIDYVWEPKRSWSWMKIKPEVTFDLEVIGFYEGEGKYVGQLGGIIVDFNGVEVRVGGGFKDTERENIWVNRPKYLGHKAEVYAMEVTEAGSLRHPEFRNWRFDL